MLLSETSLTVGSVGLIIKRWEKRTTYCISIVIIPFASHRMLSVLTLLFFGFFFLIISWNKFVCVTNLLEQQLGVRRSNPSKRLKSPDNVCIFFFFSLFFLCQFPSYVTEIISHRRVSSSRPGSQISGEKSCLTSFN